jgi:hypothetical protein
MSPRKFDSILVSIDIGASRTMRRLTVTERWTFVAGVLALASKSPVRGALLVAQREPVSFDDIAEQAGVPKATAKTTVDKLTRLDVLEWDDELGGLIVVNWNEYQREPKASDSREAWRERKQRERDKKTESRPDVTRDSHANVTPVVPVDVTPLSHAAPFAHVSRDALAKRREGKG